LSSKKIGASNKFFGPALRKARISLGLTQAKFAESLSISGSYISNLEKGEANPSEAVIRELVRTFRINRVFLETGEGEMFQNKFQQFSDRRQEELAEESAANDLVSEVMLSHKPGSIQLSVFEEALFYMMRDLPEDARRRAQMDIIMEWTAARHKKNG
jgi:transcriptional regulator with XRE-family HTH domain